MVGPAGPVLRRWRPVVGRTYRGGVGGNRRRKARDPEQVVRAVQAGLAAGLDLVHRVRPGLVTSRQAGELERAHQQALVAREAQARHYRQRMQAQRIRANGWVAAAGVSGTLALMDLLSPPYDVAPIGVVGATVASVMAVRSRLRLRHAPPPPRPLAVPPPPAVLPAGSRGYAEAERLLRVRAQLVNLVPPVSRLHPDAGDELARADAESAPALGALVERLAVLSRIERELPDTDAAAAAATSAEGVRARLVTGIEGYERLIAAAASMLAAPDLGASAEMVLGPAVDALTAYAEGLSVSADTFGAPYPH